MMNSEQFIHSLQNTECPDNYTPCLQALWHDGNGDWEEAHRIVQQLNDKQAARIHAYLHRKEGDESNSLYWHRRAGSTMISNLSFEQEWHLLVEKLLQE